MYCMLAKTTALFNYIYIYTSQIHRFYCVHEICDQSDLAMLSVCLKKEIFLPNVFKFQMYMSCIYMVLFQECLTKIWVALSNSMNSSRCGTTYSNGRESLSSSTRTDQGLLISMSCVMVSTYFSLWVVVVLLALLVCLKAVLDPLILKAYH